MKRKLIFLPIVMGLFLGACSLAPEYVKPEAPVPVDWPQGEAYDSLREAPGATEARDLQWTDIFTDPRLQAIIRTALDNNRDLRLAALNVEKARALYGVQRA